MGVANPRLGMLAAQFTGANGLGCWFETMEQELRRALSVPAAQIGLGLDPAGSAVPPWFVELLRPFAVLIELLDRAQLAGIDYERGATQRENNMPAVIRLRAAAQQLGLLRKAKRVFAATQRGRKLMDDPAALACHVAQRLVRPKGEGPKGRDIEGDSTFAGWMISAGGFVPDRMQKYSRHLELFMDKSELLEMFGYWDSNQGGPVNDQSRLPALQFWYLIERLLEFRMRAAGMEARIPQRLAALSRYLLQE